MLWFCWKLYISKNTLHITYVHQELDIRSMCSIWAECSIIIHILFGWFDALTPNVFTYEHLIPHITLFYSVIHVLILRIALWLIIDLDQEMHCRSTHFKCRAYQKRRDKYRLFKWDMKADKWINPHTHTHMNTKECRNNTLTRQSCTPLLRVRFHFHSYLQLF